MLTAKLPVRCQLITVRGRPFQNQRLCSAGQVSTHDLEGLDFELGLEFAILRMEMRWGMFVEEHADDDAVEGADRGHVRSIAMLGPSGMALTVSRQGDGGC